MNIAPKVVNIFDFVLTCLSGLLTRNLIDLNSVTVGIEPESNGCEVLTEPTAPNCRYCVVNDAIVFLNAKYVLLYPIELCTEKNI